MVSEHNMVLSQYISVWVTGSNEGGRFGDGTTTNRNGLVEVIEEEEVVVDVLVNSEYIMVLKKDDRCQCMVHG